MTATNTREQLQERRRDLLAAMQLLEQDRQDGVVDSDAYIVQRHVYESEAEALLDQLEDTGTEERRREGPSPRRRWLMLPAALAVAIAGGIALGAALHPRLHGQAVTGSVPTVAVPSFSQQIAGAQAKLAAHPHNYGALINLAQAQIHAHQLKSADRTALDALAIAPLRPQAPTIHALILGAATKYNLALALLRRVEKLHPRYSRAWLLDGILSSHSAAGYRRAIHSWRRFLALAPRDSSAPSVRRWIVWVEGKVRHA